MLTPPVYERLGVPRQRPIPRWSGVLVEPRVDRVLEKFGVTLEDLLEPGGALEARLVRSQLPAEAVEALERMRAALEAGYDTLARSAEEIDPTLARPIQGARHQALAGTQEVEKKLMQHLKRRQETELGQIARARGSVLPEQQAAGAGADRGAVSRALWPCAHLRPRRADRSVVRRRP